MIPGTDRSHLPEGYDKNIRDVAGGSEVENTEGDAIRSPSKVPTEGRQVS